MRAEIVASAGLTPETVAGRVLAHDVEAFLPDGARVRMRKGRILTPDDMPALVAADRPLHLLVLEPGDLHENAAGMRLADAVTGPGVIAGEPHESMITLRAATRGLLAVDVPRLLDINCVPEMSVWTLYDAQLVRERQAIAGVKVTPLITHEAMVREAEAIAQGGWPGDRGAPVRAPARRASWCGSNSLRRRVRGSARRSRQRCDWFGSAITAITAPRDDSDAITAAIQRFSRGWRGHAARRRRDQHGPARPHRARTRHARRAMGKTRCPGAPRQHILARVPRIRRDQERTRCPCSAWRVAACSPAPRCSTSSCPAFSRANTSPPAHLPPSATVACSTATWPTASPTTLPQTSPSPVGRVNEDAMNARTRRRTEERDSSTIRLSTVADTACSVVSFAFMADTAFAVMKE